MTFAELLQEVYDITNRADLVTKTTMAIKAATLKAHRSDFYSKDIYETGAEFQTSKFRQSWDYIALVPNYRAIKYVKRVTDENDEIGKLFDIILPEEILDSYGVNRSDIAYVAGRILEIRSSVSFNKILFGCYVSPTIIEANYLSWIANLYPYAIIFEAARIIFKTTGDKEQATSYKDLVAEQYAELKISNITDVGW